jgi:ATP-binding cassette subfamily B protein
MKSKGCGILNKKSAKKFRHVRKNILSIAISAAPVLFFLTLLWGMLHGIFSVMITVTTNAFFTSAESMINGAINENRLFLQLFLLAVCYVSEHLFLGLHNSAIEKMSFRLQRRFNEVIQDKTACFGTLFFESAEHLNLIQKAVQGAEHGTFFINVLGAIVSYYIPYFIFMGIFFVTLNDRLILVLVLIFIPELISQLFRVRQYAGLEDTSAVLNRKYIHYEDCIRGKAFFKETRLLGAFSYFFELYRENIKLHNRAKWRTDRKVFGTKLVTKAITLTGYGLVIFLLIQELRNGSISAASFAAIFTSLNTMFTMTGELMDGHIARLSGQLGSIRNLTEFLGDRFDGNAVWNSSDRHTQQRADEGHIEEDPKTEHTGIVLKNVSFCYPSHLADGQYALKDISLRLKKGELLAVVGENGSGKSTLSKVMTGIYPPTEGTVWIDGQPVRQESWRLLRTKVSAVFQTFQKYGLCLMENITISDPAKGWKAEDMENLIESVGLRGVCREDVLLSREFGGIDLSMGQWQRLAIARGIFKDSPILILDEPTASIDPLEEFRLYELFSQITKDNTAVLITHRLSAARLADKIAVLEHGRLVEYGTHDELLRLNGVYARLFFSQKQLFVLQDG